MFNGEDGIAFHAMQGNRASSLGEGEVSWFFPSCCLNLEYILEFQRAWPFKTRVCSATSELLSRYGRHLTKLHEAWQVNTNASLAEAGDPGSLSNCHSNIGIPIKFQQESGIVTF